MPVVSGLIVLMQTKTPYDMPEIIWNPIGEDNFKKALLKAKKVYITWEYCNGKKETKLWNADDVTDTTNLRNNIESRSQWRNKNGN